MKLRTQLTLAFLFLAVLPLAGIVLYSYTTSLRAFRLAVETESEQMAAQIGGRMDAVRDDTARLVEDLGQLPLPLLVAAQDGQADFDQASKLYPVTHYWRPRGRRR